MKVWIGYNPFDREAYVSVFSYKPEPEQWKNEEKYWCELKVYKERAVIVCRNAMTRLLEGTGKKLPKPATNELVEVELFVK